MSRFVRAKKRLWFSSLPLPHALKNGSASTTLRSSSNVRFSSELTGFKSIPQSCTLERACIDEFSKENRRFCKLFKVSERAKRVLVPKNWKPEDNSPPFYHDPSLGVDQILEAVFRARATFFVGKKNKVFSGWVAAPSSSESNAVAFTAGHCYDSHVGFSEVTVCFGGQVGASDFDTIGLDCAVQPITVCNGDEDLAVFEVFDAVEHVFAAM